jgi:hypothetical protein
MAALVVARAARALPRACAASAPASSSVLFSPASLLCEARGSRAPSAAAASSSSSSSSVRWSSSSSPSTTPFAEEVEAEYIHAGPRARILKVPTGPGRRETYVASRIQAIQTALAGQDKLRKDFFKQRPPKQGKRGILQYIKKQAWEKD